MALKLFGQGAEFEMIFHTGCPVDPADGFNDASMPQSLGHLKYWIQENKFF
jgi:hypothetical protein